MFIFSSEALITPGNSCVHRIDSHLIHTLIHQVTHRYTRSLTQYTRSLTQYTRALTRIHPWHSAIQPSSPPVSFRPLRPGSAVGQTGIRHWPLDEGGRRLFCCCKTITLLPGQNLLLILYTEYLRLWVGTSQASLARQEVDRKRNFVRKRKKYQHNNFKKMKGSL